MYYTHVCKLQCDRVYASRIQNEASLPCTLYSLYKTGIVVHQMNVNVSLWNSFSRVSVVMLRALRTSINKEQFVRRDTYKVKRSSVCHGRAGLIHAAVGSNSVIVYRVCCYVLHEYIYMNKNTH
jgi:hypothetical protein